MYVVGQMKESKRSKKKFQGREYLYSSLSHRGGDEDGDDNTKGCRKK
jgi:hypothetical protein